MLPLLCFQNLGPNSCFPPSQSRDCIVETPLNALLASWQNLSSDLERPLHKQISESICTSFREGYCRPNPFFKHHKAAASIKSSPSRTNTNLNTLQCSFPKPPSIQPLSRPFPRTHPSPQICSATIEKALGLRRWPLQGYDRWSGARSARFPTSGNRGGQ